MKYKVVIGVDVSKNTLDFHSLLEGESVFHLQVSNDRKGILKFYNRLKQEVGEEQHWLICMEHTGIYCNPLLAFAREKQLMIWLEDAVKIKAYHGLDRDKSDAVDARRIAEYAHAKRDKVRLWQPPRAIITQLKNQLSLRERLVSAKTRLTKPLNEDQRFADKQWAKQHETLIQPVIEKLNAQIKEVEHKIRSLIKTDTKLKRYFELVCSVRGIGLIVGVNLIVASNEFISIDDPKKMACQCGVAPFKKESGTSYRSRPRVSHRANKHLKALLHLAAMSAISGQGELRDYYLRKVEEGKNKMAVINAVRNKIILRVFACIRDNRKYQNSYNTNLA